MINLKNFDKNITNDSRVLEQGDIFILEKSALPFLSQIIAKKPLKILASYELKNQISTNIEIVFYNNTNEIVSLLQSYYLLPSNIWAITGTNGKTSTAYFISQIWNLLNTKNLSIGTLGAITGDNKKLDSDTVNTTPSIYKFYSLLSQAKKMGIDHVIFEASSHGLKQNRVDGIEVKIAGITNFTQDHLDLHGNMKEYFNAKMLLFEKYLKGVAIINADIPEFDYIAMRCQNFIDYGYNAKCIKILKTEFIKDSFNIELSINGSFFSTLFPISSSFQIYNICATIGFFIAAKIEAKTIIELIPKLKSPPGRMERISDMIFIDYAHTPDALEKVLENLKDNFGNIVVVFGCGGDRDKTKRPIMGNIAARLADVVIITDDNPRTENAIKIREEIIGSNKHFIEIGDREKAIKYAIKNYPNYCILIAGKGHENYQIIGIKKHYFSDQEVAKKEVNKSCI